MAEINPNTMTAILAAGALYTQLMPSLAEVRRAQRGGDVAGDVRNGIVVGSGLLVGVGALIALDQRNPKPLYLMAGAALLLAAAYEGTLRRPGSVPPAVAPAEPRLRGRYGI